MEEFQPTPVNVGERSQALLFEAFGSMNLGKPGEMQEKIAALERAAGEREEAVRSLEERLAERNEGHQNLKARISELHVQVTRCILFM